MLISEKSARFWHRPYNTVTCIRFSPIKVKNIPSKYNNEYNPLCTCVYCTKIFEDADITNSFLFQEYLTSKIAHNRISNPHPLFFMQTHAYMNRDSLPEDKKILHSDVSDKWVRRCNEICRNAWPTYQNQAISDLSKNCNRFV